jgi:hypothetical protein
MATTLEKVFAGDERNIFESEARRIFVELVQLDQYVGDVYSISYETALVQIHDFHRQKVGGIPGLSFLIATRVDPDKPIDYKLEDSSVILLRVMDSAPLNALSRLAVVMDGPLAVHGQPAWLSMAISKELARLNGKLRAATGTDLLIVGVEKSGFFVEHFEKLCAAADAGRLPFAMGRQTALLLTDEYIKKQVIFTDGQKPYGEATYFGRKLLYRTKSGAKIVASLPYLEPNHRDLTTAQPDQYPRLADALSLFDALVSSRYPNALIPVALAHGEAAIPLRHGTRVLERLARELIRAGE